MCEVPGLNLRSGIVEALEVRGQGAGRGVLNVAEWVGTAVAGRRAMRDRANGSSFESATAWQSGQSSATCSTTWGRSLQMLSRVQTDRENLENNPRAFLQRRMAAWWWLQGTATSPQMVSPTYTVTLSTHIFRDDWRRFCLLVRLYLGLVDGDLG